MEKRPRVFDNEPTEKSLVPYDLMLNFLEMFTKEVQEMKNENADPF